MVLLLRGERNEVQQQGMFFKCFLDFLLGLFKRFEPVRFNVWRRLFVCSNGLRLGFCYRFRRRRWGDLAGFGRQLKVDFTHIGHVLRRTECEAHFVNSIDFHRGHCCLDRCFIDQGGLSRLGAALEGRTTLTAKLGGDRDRFSTCNAIHSFT